MKILFCQTQFKLGGQQRVLLTIAKQLSKKHDVTIYYENHDFFDLSDLNTIRPNKRVQIKNLVCSLMVHLFKFKFNKKLVADYWHLLNLKDTMTNREYDLIILLNPYILFVDEVKKIMKSKKVVCWTHNLYENYVENYFKDEKKQLFLNMKLADQIVSLERHTASKWKEVNPNTIIIHNPVTIDNGNREANLKSNKISFVGRVDIDSKGLDYLCEMTTLLDNDITVHFAGSGNIDQEKEFKSMITKYSLEDRLILHGALKDEDLLKHYEDSFAFVMTSRVEGFPLVSVEAMSFGLPVIGFDIPSLREVTNDGKFGKLFPIRDVSSMAKFLNELYLSDDLKYKYSRLSLSRAEELKLDSIIKCWEDQVLNDIK